MLMKTTAKIEVELHPFSVPNYVAVKGETVTTSIRIKELNAEVLAQLCDEFRAAIFKKAGKDDPAKRKGGRA